MILTSEQINELVDRLKPLGCNHTSYEDSVNILYKYYTVFEYRMGMNEYSVIQIRNGIILTARISGVLHYFNNYTFDVNIIENIIQNFITALEKQEKEDKVRKKKKDLEKDFEESN